MAQKNVLRRSDSLFAAHARKPTADTVAAGLVPLVPFGGGLFPSPGLRVTLHCRRSERRLRPLALRKARRKRGDGPGWSGPKGEKRE